MEISVMVARNTSGQMASYPTAENIHQTNILRQTVCPARTSERAARRAEEIAMETMRVLRGAGVFGIEMFLMEDETILINEIAPRVHNSGHHTLQSSETSQFRQHLLAILGDGPGRHLAARARRHVQHTGAGRLHGPVTAPRPYRIRASTSRCTERRPQSRSESWATST